SHNAPAPTPPAPPHRERELLMLPADLDFPRLVLAWGDTPLGGRGAIWMREQIHTVENLHLAWFPSQTEAETSWLGAAFHRGGWLWTRLSRTFRPSTMAYRSGPPLQFGFACILSPTFPCRPCRCRGASTARKSQLFYKSRELAGSKLIWPAERIRLRYRPRQRWRPNRGSHLRGRQRPSWSFDPCDRACCVSGRRGTRCGDAGRSFRGTRQARTAAPRHLSVRWR